MMQHEFEQIAGYKVSQDSYDNIIEPMYMATSLSKSDFVKMLNRKAFEVKPVREPDIRKMLVRDRLGCARTPNGCWDHVEYVDLVSVDVATGKFVVAPLKESTLSGLARTCDLNLSASYDFDYLNCLDVHRKPVTLHWSF